MSVRKPVSKSGSAPIVKQGHTATQSHGSDPNMRRKPEVSVRDLSVK